jgi:hypothetical protein
MQLKEEQRLKNKDNRTNKLLLNVLIRTAYGDNKALNVQMTYQEVLNDIDIKLA